MRPREAKPAAAGGGYRGRRAGADGAFPRIFSARIVRRPVGHRAPNHRVLLPRRPLRAGRAVQSYGKSVDESLRSVGYTSASKPFVFVAMPFAQSMEDVFHYGIRNAVKEAGLLCERADQSSFTGDVLDWVRERIAAATLVIADLTSANPNVYLEVGYAWGCGKPTVLIAAEASDLTFDVKSQRCLIYNHSIKSLEQMLRTELVALREDDRSGLLPRLT